jgi:hypothetical protein
MKGISNYDAIEEYRMKWKTWETENKKDKKEK